MKLTVLQSGSAGNGYVLEGTRSALLIECGVRPEVFMRGCDVKVSALAGALITHEHGDHAGYARRYAALGVPIYASRGTIEALRPFNYAAKLRVVHSLHAFRVGDFFVRAFDTRHDAAEPLGYIIEHRECGRILFLTDSAGCKYNFRDLYLDHILIEANYDDGILAGNVANGVIDAARAQRTRDTHMSLRDACEFVHANQTASLKTVVLIHLSRDNGSAAQFADKMAETALFARIMVAKAGLSIEVNSSENFTVL